MPIDEAQMKIADELHELARTLDDEEALATYAKVLVIDPNRSSTHYNIGLLYKYQGKWQESFEHNLKSCELCPDDESANWNLGIAATALRNWRVARDVWNRLGMNVELGDDPIDLDFGQTPVRLNPDDRGEVVWGTRIDPVRVRLANIPYPHSGFRCQDVVLHDGAAVGYRKIGEREYPVFNVFELFESSKLSTFEAEIIAPTHGDIEALVASFDQEGIECEDWTANVRTLCRQCSEGTPHADHDHDLDVEWKDRHILGIGANDASKAERVLKQWESNTRRGLSFTLALSPEHRH